MHKLGYYSVAITIFISAFLLFQIQPLISRFILPWFGGTPAVWSASLVFFQTCLLAGYAYAHWLSSRKKGQPIFHLFLLASSVIILLISATSWGAPLLPAPSWKPPDETLPFARIILILAVSIGLPYFILSSTSPLLQSWFKYLVPSQIPYRLYALSNFGSLLALISYPVIFEPLLSLKEQSRIWSLSYVFFAGLCGYISMRVLSVHQSASDSIVEVSPALISQGEARQPALFRKLLWIALPACTSILLLSITNQLTQEVAVIPFLWVLPLSIYLFSFTITFSGEKWYHQSLYLVLLGASTLLLSYALAHITSIGVFAHIVIFSFFLLMATLVIHGELYRLRPDPRHLTSFYLLVSLGGAIGGMFVNLMAPVIFRGFWELHMGVLLCWLLVVILLINDKQAILHRCWVWVTAPLFLLVVGVTSVVLFNHIKSTLLGVLEMQRNFYGVIRVRTISVGEPAMDAFSLSHGITSHGFQFVEPERREIPTSYYGKESGVGLAITHYAQAVGHNPLPGGLKVGVIGLGTGTLAVYGNREDYYRFYEINPAIIDLALGEHGYFSYLQDTPAAFDIVSGDARVSLEKELERGSHQNFDILAVDAFSGDSIPIHLLTEEAFAIYLRHLKPEGILAIHISNRYLDLAPLVRALGELNQLDQALIASPRDDSGSYPAVWILLSKNRSFFRLPEIVRATEPLPEETGEIRAWTDDFSNLLQVMRMNVFFRAR